MAQQHTKSDKSNSPKWEIGQECDIYCRAERRWVDGQILDIFQDEEGEWVKVKYGRKTNHIQPDDPDIRSKATGKMMENPNRQKAIVSREAKVTSAVTELMSKIQPFVHEVIAKSHDLKQEEIKDALTWYNVMQCVRHELYPAMAVALSQAVEEMVFTSGFAVGDLSEDAVHRVIEVLKTKKVLFSKEIKYIEGVVDRARAFEWEQSESTLFCVISICFSDHNQPLRRHCGFTYPLNAICDFESDDASFDALNRFENDHDLNLKYPGLTANLLIGIYGVHKALLFGQFQFKEYTKKDFMTDIKEAEQRVFDEPICSPIIEKHESAFNLSFHPSYLINDDMFEVMACHFAVSALVNRLEKKQFDGNELTILSLVVPVAITSIYDPVIDYKSTIKVVADYINSISPDAIHLCRRLQSTPNSIESMTRSLIKMVGFVLQNASAPNCVIVFNRRKGSRERNMVHVFECSDCSELTALNRDCFLGFEFDVKWPSIGTIDNESRRLNRCWMSYGHGNRMRFYPEYLKWIIPRFFMRDGALTAAEMMTKLYGAEYKWGWRVTLDDPAFNRYYHIITKYEHITNNYNRTEMESSLRRDSECGLRDHLEHKLDRNSIVFLNRYFQDQAIDSDAILEDSLAAKRVNDGKHSNIFRFLTETGLNVHFKAFRHTLLRYRGTVCCTENVVSNEECPFIEDLVTDLERLKACELDIDATNVWQFELDDIVASWAHILSVHRLLSEDDDDKETKQQIQNHILQRVQCGAGSKCKALTTQKQRRRETDKAHRVEVVPDAVAAECEAVEEGLFGIHCQIFHGQNEQKRSEPSDDEKDTESRFKMAVPTATTEEEQKVTENDDKAPVAIDFGRTVLRWLNAGDSPRFDTLRNELILNPHSTIDLIIYDRLRKWAIARSQQSDDTVDESLGLKAYSDTNDFQAALGRAHWDSASQDDRRSFYQWAMTLYRVHLRSAVPIPPATATGTTPRPLYTGMSIVLSLGHELGAYYGPLSTTTTKAVATRFSKGKGQIYKYGSSYINPLRCTVGIDMQSISCYPQEHEIMLYHSVVPISSTVTQDDSPDVLVNHLLFSLQSRPTPIVRKEAFFKKLGIRWTSSWIPLIFSHKMLTAKTKYKDRTVRYRLGDEMQIATFMMMNLFAGNNSFSSKQLGATLNSVDSDSELMLSFTDDPEDIFYFTKYVIVGRNTQHTKLSESEVNIFGLTVFAKASNRSFPDVKLGRFASNIYAFEGEEPLVILKALKLPVCKPETSVGGMLEIRYSSDIVISAKGVIDGSATRLIDNEQIQRMKRYRKGMELKDRMQTPCRILCGDNIDVDHEHNEDDKEDDNDQDGQEVLYAIGGDVRLISKTTITNSGTLQSDPSHNKVLIGGMIHMEANSFVNEGIVQCINGSVDVHCTKYVNTGIIRPIPDIFIKNGSNNLLATNLQFESEFLIPLSLYDHHGHRYGHEHPNSLLVDNVDSYYVSTSGCTVSDWIIFKVNHRAKIKPTAVSIRNVADEEGIKRIALYMGCDTGDWIKICKNIPGIHNNDKEPQRFELSLIVSDEELMKLRADLILLEVVSNHGSQYFNRFYSFQVFGCPLST